MESYIFDTEDNNSKRSLKYYVLVIYDITDNKKRLKLAKLMKSFGFRVQKSAFEARLSEAKYQKLMKALEPFPQDEDSIRVYKLRGEGVVTVFGKDDTPEYEDVIVI